MLLGRGRALRGKRGAGRKPNCGGGDQAGRPSARYPLGKTMHMMLLSSCETVRPFVIVVRSSAPQSIEKMLRWT
jgi:hypothetical protein